MAAHLALAGNLDTPVIYITMHIFSATWPESQNLNYCDNI